MTSKGKIRLILVSVMLVSLSTSFLSLMYMNRMVRVIGEIVSKDAKITELGEMLSIYILEARREEKNFIIYSDSTYIDRIREIVEMIRDDIIKAKEIAKPYSSELDSIIVFVSQYNANIDQLVRTFQQNPRILNRLQRQVINYENELRQLAQKRKIDMAELPSWASDIHVSVAAAGMKLSADQAKLFNELRETASGIQRLSERVSARARESLAIHSSEGMSYGVKAQRNTITVLLIAILLLIYLIVYFPHRILIPFQRITKALQAIGRGEDRITFPNIHKNDEMGNLSRSIMDAIQKLRMFNDLKTGKIVELRRSLSRILEEVDESVLILSPDLRITFSNEPARTLFEISEDLAGKSIKDIHHIWNVLENPLTDIEKKGRVEEKLRIKEGSIIKKDVLFIPSIDNNGKLNTIIIVVK